MANGNPGSVPPASAPPAMSRRDYWRALLEECHASGLSQTEFCRQRGIKRRSLSFWKWKVSHEAGAGRPRRRVFVPVRVIPTRRRSGEVASGSAPAWDGEIEIVLGSGRLVRVRGRVDAEWLRQVMATVGSTRC